MSSESDIEIQSSNVKSRSKPKSQTFDIEVLIFDLTHMLYHYVASDKSGKIVEDDVDAANLGGVLQHLASRELRPVSVRPYKEQRGMLRAFVERITVTDKVFLTKYLSLMLKVGTDLLSAVNIMIADFDKPAMRNFLLEVRDNLSRGRPFYEAFARYPRAFSAVFVNLVRAAETSGNLQNTFEELSRSLEREAELRNRIRSALIYPILLLVTALGVFLFLVSFALPRIARIFLESGINPPFFSRVVFGVGLFVNDHLFAFLVVLFIILGPGLYFFLRHPVGRRLTEQVVSRLPVIRKIYRDIAIQRFAATFSSLMKAGMPIIQTTKVTAGVVGAEGFRVSLLRIADEGLAKGLTIGEAFRREPVFPRVVANLIAISEKAGHLEEVLGALSEFYASNIDASIRSLVSLIEPLLLMSMGVIVASIALAIIVPIYQLTAQF